MASRYFSLDIEDGDHKPVGTLGKHYLSKKTTERGILFVGYPTSKQEKLSRIFIKNEDIQKVKLLGYNSGKIWIVWKPRSELERVSQKFKLSNKLIQFVEEFPNLEKRFESPYKEGYGRPEFTDSVSTKEKGGVMIHTHYLWDRGLYYNSPLKEIYGIYLKKGFDALDLEVLLDEFFGVPWGQEPAKVS